MHVVNRVAKQLAFSEERPWEKVLSSHALFSFSLWKAVLGMSLSLCLLSVDSLIPILWLCFDFYIFLVINTIDFLRSIFFLSRSDSYSRSLCFSFFWLFCWFWVGLWRVWLLRCTNCVLFFFFLKFWIFETLIGYCLGWFFGDLMICVLMRCFCIIISFQNLWIDSLCSLIWSFDVSIDNYSVLLCLLKFRFLFCIIN